MHDSNLFQNYHKHNKAWFGGFEHSYAIMNILALIEKPSVHVSISETKLSLKIEIGYLAKEAIAD